MAKYVIDDSTLIAIGDAIREKNGTSETMTPAEMATAISAIETGSGGGDSSIVDAIIDRTITELESDIEKVGAYVFYDCEKLSRVRLPNATTLFDHAFRSCAALTEVYVPNVERLAGNCLRDDVSIVRLDLPKVKQFNASAMQGCSKLECLILRANSVCSMSNANNIADTPIEDGTGYVYVPAALVNSYKTATNWSTYAAQIRAIEDYPEITGG